MIRVEEGAGLGGWEGHALFSFASSQWREKIPGVFEWNSLHNGRWATAAFGLIHFRDAAGMNAELDRIPPGMPGPGYAGLLGDKT